MKSLLFFISAFTEKAISQPASQTKQKLPDSEISFLKSMVLPAWEHYKVSHSEWTRGKYHLAAVLILSYLTPCQYATGIIANRKVHF
ncbi:MAG: hypothetical protein PVH63_09365 [Balneolaceae bacterium]|jgi:hypothetical protein